MSLLVTEHLVVRPPSCDFTASRPKTITGKGRYQQPSTIDADTVCIDDVEAASVICKRLIAKRAQAPEIFALRCCRICFLSAAYVEPVN